MKKRISTKEKEIKNLMEKLGIDREQALDVYKFDRGEIDNEEVTKIEEKTQANKKPQGSSLDKVRLMQAKKKVDGERETVLNSIFIFIQNLPFIELFTQVTSSKMCLKTKTGTYYTVTVTKNKDRPSGLME